MIPTILSRINTEPFAMLGTSFAQLDSRIEIAAKTNERFNLPSGAMWSNGIVGPTIEGKAFIPQLEVVGSTAIIQVNGALMLGVTLWDAYFFNAFDYDWLTDFCEQAKNIPGIKNLLIVWNSPGGSCIGVEEAAASLAAVQAQGIKITHYSRQCVASAAYRLTLGGPLIVSQSCIVGCIGTISKALDNSKAATMAGLENRVFTSDGLGNPAPLKAAGTNMIPITEEVANDLQKKTHTAGAIFRNAVTAARPNAKGPSLLGGWDFGADAVANGIADMVCDTIAPVIAALS